MPVLKRRRFVQRGAEADLLGYEANPRGMGALPETVREMTLGMAPMQKRPMEETPPTASEQYSLLPSPLPQFEMVPVGQYVGPLPAEPPVVSFLVPIPSKPILGYFTMPLADGQYTI